VAAGDDGKRPVVAVLADPADGMPPGLDPLIDTVDFRLATDGETLSAAIPEAQVLMVTDFRSGAVEAAWPHAAKLEWVHATSAGVDRLMFPALVDSPVPVTNAKGVFDRGIAEFVLGVALAWAKDLPGTLDNQRARVWRHRDTETLEGRRALVVGAGSIGREIGRLLSAVGVHVEGVASRARADDPVFPAVHATEDLLDLLPGFDLVVIATPLTPATNRLFGPAAFRAMRPTARLVNIGRGEVVDTEALMAALRAREIAAAALDVFEDEPLPADHPLWETPGALVSPHMSGDLIGWRSALSAQFVENFRRWRDGRPLFNLVDKARGYAAAS